MLVHALCAALFAAPAFAGPRAPRVIVPSPALALPALHAPASVLPASASPSACVANFARPDAELPAAPAAIEQLRLEARAALSGPIAELVDGDGAPIAPAPTAIRRALRRVGRWAAPPIMKPSFDESAEGFYYHGTSMAALAEIVLSGGEMAKHRSYFSDEAGFPYGYARSRARYDRSVGVLLQFEEAPLADRLRTGHYQPVIGGDRAGPIRQLAKFSMAVAPAPLSAQTAGSKRTVLAWLERRRDSEPGNPAWPRLLDAFRSAFQ